MPFIVPDLLIMTYCCSEPADILSCRVVLVAMLIRELHWDKPTSDQAEYYKRKDLKYSVDPGRKIDNLPPSLLPLLGLQAGACPEQHLGQDSEHVLLWSIVRAALV